MTPAWRTAVTATLHCLTGCAIGEVLGMVLATWWGWSDGPTVVLSVALAFLFSYLLTFVGVRRSGADVATAVRLALASGTVSIAVLELVGNGFMLAVPGALEAAAFLVAVPVNKWLIERGLGHAVVHRMHEHHH